MADHVSFECGTCRKPTKARKGSDCALLQICAECQDKRVKKGRAAQREAVSRG